MFLEPKRIYRAVTGEVPEGDHREPIGKARTVREGTDVSLFAYGAMIPPATEACQSLEAEGISPGLIDLRTLVPLDAAAVLASDQEHRAAAVVIHEAARFCGYGAEIAALLAEKAFFSLKAPIARVTGFDTPFPYALENLYLPNAARIHHAVVETVKAG